MFKMEIVRTSLTALAMAALLVGIMNPAMAKNSVSLGNGVKCTWVLVSSVGNNNTYKQVCRKGV